MLLLTSRLKRAAWLAVFPKINSASSKVAKAKGEEMGLLRPDGRRSPKA